jgi:hypothetical protein
MSTTSKEAVTLVVVSSLFIIVILYLMPHVQDTTALHCLVYKRYSTFYGLKVYGTCCDTQTDKEGIEITYCTDCNVDDRGQFSNCGQRYTVREGLPLPPGQPNGNLTSSQSNTTNSTTPSSGLLNGRIPTGKLGNAPPITTFNAPASGNTSNPGNNTTTTSIKATRGIYSPTGGCIPGGSTCVPCDIGLARIGANCIPSGDWHPTNGLPPSSTFQQQQPTTPPSTTTTPPPSAGLLNKAPPPTATTCPDGSQPDANGKCPSSGSTTTSHAPLAPLTNTKNQGGPSNNNNNNNAGTNPIKHCSKTNAGGPHCPKAG